MSEDRKNKLIEAGKNKNKDTVDKKIVRPAGSVKRILVQNRDG